MIILVDSILHLKIIRFISLLYWNDPESRKEDHLITPRSCDMVLGDNTKKVWYGSGRYMVRDKLIRRTYSAHEIRCTWKATVLDIMSDQIFPGKFCESAIRMDTVITVCFHSSIDTQLELWLVCSAFVNMQLPATRLMYLVFHRETISVSCLSSHDKSTNFRPWSIS